MLLSTALTYAQGGYWSNGGALISITDTAFLSVQGDMINSNGGVYHNLDSIFLTGDWQNNDASHVFDSSQAGTVFFIGDSQRIRGTQETYFYNLILKNTGTKFTHLDAKVNGVLDLTDRELNADSNTIWVRNPKLDAVRRTSGFLSSINDGGLLRYINRDSIYLFPVGSSNGATRYRPIEITPTSSQPNQFKVRFAHVDANTDAYDRGKKSHLICTINPLWYHRIYHPQGSDSARLNFFYDPSIDGLWNELVQWHITPQWVAMKRDTILNGSPFTSIYRDHWSDFSTSPFALAIISPPYANAGPDDTICSGTSVQLGFINAPSTTYLWTPSYALNDSSLGMPTATPIHAGNSDTTFTYTVIANYLGCTDTDHVKIKVYPPISVDAGISQSICYGQEVTLNGAISGGASDGVWSAPSGTFNDSTLLSATYTPSVMTGNIVLTLTSANLANPCLAVIDTLTITVLNTPTANAGNDISIFQFDTAQLSASGGSIYSWSPLIDISNTQISNPKVYPTASTIYIVTVKDSNQCSSVDTILVTVTTKPDSLFFIPDVITPNGDGINDNWFIKDLDRFPNNQVRIINRWGDEVYQSKPYLNDWTGTYKDGELPGATYYYELKIKEASGKELEFNGPITIVK